MTQQLRVVQGQARHNDVSFSYEYTLMRTPDGWVLMRGSLKCPMQHREWLYASGRIKGVTHVSY